MSIADNIDFTIFVTQGSWQKYSRQIRRRSVFGNVTKRAVPERLVLAPYDMLSTDPATALEIYSGRFFFAGHLVELEGRNPFLENVLNSQWQRELHAFKWLRHLEAAQTSLSKHNAQTLVRDWMATHGRPKRSIAWHEEIAAQRLISWIFHCLPIVETADTVFYRNWLKSFSIHIRYLKRVSSDAPDGFPRLICRIALAFAAICISGQKSYLRNSASRLDDELLRQVLPDGGHISRNPAMLPQILCLLLPLRQSYVKTGLAPSNIMISAIDRMMAALKFYRLGDGNIARFNGVATTPGELVAAILRHDDSKGLAANEALASGYQRIEKSETILLAETGTVTKGEISKTAHAGTLSFEFSCGKLPIVVNCGQPFISNENAKQSARLTAAHSTAIINDHSSSKFYKGSLFGLHGQILSGPGKVNCKRQEHESSTTLATNHDGYLKRFGVIHHRLLGVSGDGMRIIGEDKFTGQSAMPLTTKSQIAFTIRFHLHPSLSAGKTEDGRSIIILGGSGIAWKFTCVDVVPELQESIFFASHNGPRRTRQIVLNGDASKVSDIRWVFEKQLQKKQETEDAGPPLNDGSDITQEGG